MYIRNAYFLAEMAFLLGSAIAFFIWCCKNSKSEYQRMLEENRRGGEIE